MNYPNQTGHVAYSKTSEASATALDESGRAGTYDAKILIMLKARETHGATAEEMRKELNKEFPHVHNGSVNGRMSTLWRRKEIVKTKLTRKTDANKQAHVYVHAAFRGMVDAEPEYVDVAGPDMEAALQLAQMLFDAMKFTKDGGAVINLMPLDLAIAENLAARAALKK